MASVASSGWTVGPGSHAWGFSRHPAEAVHHFGFIAVAKGCAEGRTAASPQANSVMLADESDDALAGTKQHAVTLRRCMPRAMRVAHLSLVKMMIVSSICSVWRSACVTSPEEKRSFFGVVPMIVPSLSW
jgi:hypothetical protein